MFHDAATPSPFRTGRAANGKGFENGACGGLSENGGDTENGGSIENGSSIEKDDADEFIFLDCLAYGVGCCSLQVMRSLIYVIVFLSFLLHGGNYSICSVTNTAIVFSQVTFQAGSLSDTCYMYDQLAVLCPIMVRLVGNTCKESTVRRSLILHGIP